MCGRGLSWTLAGARRIRRWPRVQSMRRTVLDAHPAARRIATRHPPSGGSFGVVNTLAAPFSHFAAGAEVVSLDRVRTRRALSERTSRLSDRELDVIAGLARGLATEEIAQQMFLSPHTIRSHVKAAMRKLGASTRTHAVAIARMAGAIDEV